MVRLTEILDNFGKNLSRVKNVGVIILLLISAVSLTQNGCDRNEAEKMVEKITGLNIQNDILRRDVVEMDSALMAKNDSIYILKQDIIESNQRSYWLNKKYTEVRERYEDLAGELIKITTDSSYAFLNTKAYPYEGERKYPFNEPQVRAIHKAYLENENLVALNENLQDQKDELAIEISLKDAMNTEITSSMMIMRESKKSLEQIIENKDEEIEANKKKENRKKFGNFLRMTGVAAVALIVGFIAGG